MDTIVCPHCKKRVELTQAIIHDLSEKVRIEEKEKLIARFEEQKAKEQAGHEKRLREEFEKESKASARELELAKKKEEELLARFEKEREERGKFEEKAKEEAAKEARLEKLELEKKLRDTQLALEDAQRKSKQGSSQLRGEVLELDIEENLRKSFPTDEFLPVPKGVEGADIWQKVIGKEGKAVGSIVWEIKRAKIWSNNWPLKLREDMRKIGASQAILVSDILPKDVSNFDRKEGIFMCNFSTYLGTASLVRILLLSISAVKSATNKKDEELEEIRNYIMSEAFLHKIQAHFDNVEKLRKLHEQEKRSSAIRWKSVDAYLSRLDVNTSEFYAELQGVVPNLPSLSELEPDLLLSEGDDKEQTLF